MEIPPRAIWLDVDGTSETGDATDWEDCMANKQRPPLRRLYNYNYPLFEALTVAPGVDRASIVLFTAYTARCELLDWIASEYSGKLHVSGVATVLDPAFGHGPGAYYRSVIEPIERAVLRMEKDLTSTVDETVVLNDSDLVETVSPVDWHTVSPMTFGELLLQEEQLAKQYFAQVDAPGGGGCNDEHAAPCLDKEALARLCLTVPLRLPSVEDNRLTQHRRVLFLDDRLSYIAQVEKACRDLAADCQSVHVTPNMTCVADFLSKMSSFPPISGSSSESGKLRGGGCLLS
eukprot:TRINITY_DN33917_c0_g1_i1.p1 TRINITY_DN33917_c0_g1~~TRINITY_DN33917_c0_g1_i1.p1  ORF type:complete len:304 (-),score=45.57 TRINITY_DN33917_c0_g1_i1:90-956(-)